MKARPSNERGVSEHPSIQSKGGGEAMLALADRCEREGPNRELDADIEVAIKPGAVRTPTIPASQWVYAVSVDSTPYHPPEYTRSLDAAVTLVPEGFRLRNMDQGDPTLKYMPPAAEMIPLNNCDAEWAAMERAEGGRLRGTGNTLPLALCAAALRARAASEPPIGTGKKPRDVVTARGPLQAGKRTNYRGGRSVNIEDWPRNPNKGDDNG